MRALQLTEVARYAGREQRCPGKYVVGVAPDVVAAFAEYVTVPARNVVALPGGGPVELGALVEPLAVAVHALRRAGVRPGQGPFRNSAGVRTPAESVLSSGAARSVSRSCWPGVLSPSART